MRGLGIAFEILAPAADVGADERAQFVRMLARETAIGHEDRVRAKARVPGGQKPRRFSPGFCDVIRLGDEIALLKGLLVAEKSGDRKVLRDDVELHLVLLLEKLQKRPLRTRDNRPSLEILECPDRAVGV